MRQFSDNIVSVRLGKHMPVDYSTVRQILDHRSRRLSVWHDRGLPDKANIRESVKQEKEDSLLFPFSPPRNRARRWVNVAKSAPAGPLVQSLILKYTPMRAPPSNTIVASRVKEEHSSVFVRTTTQVIGTGG